MEKIKFTCIFEMIGRPKEHLTDTMKQLIKVIEEEKGIKILNSKVHEPKVVEPKDEKGNLMKIPKEQLLFSTFAEVDSEAEEIMKILLICFKYMPSHIEITEPEEFKLSNLDFNAITNEILAKLHNYDSIAKSALMNNQALAGKLKEVMQKAGMLPQETQEVQEIKAEEDMQESKPSKKSVKARKR